MERQPKAQSHHHKWHAQPPTEKPICDMAMALARWASNQLTIDTIRVAKPPRLDPRAIKMKATK